MSQTYDLQGTLTIDYHPSAASSKPNRLQVMVKLERDEEGWVVASSPDVPGAFSQGKSREEALEKMVDAVSLVLEETTGNSNAEFVIISKD